jgi:hypothetical protein
MKRILNTIFFLFFLLWTTVSPVSGQEATPGINRFAIFEVDIRPEFDDPQVLVIYHIVLTPDTKFPATVTIPIPARVKSPNAVAWVDPTDGSMYSLTYQSRTEGELLFVTFITTVNEIQLEYYDPALRKDGVRRDFTYDWSGNMDIDNFSVFLQQPVGAKNMVISPGMGEPKVSETGVVYFYSKLGAIKADDVFSINMSYEKESDTLSIENLDVEPAAPIDDSTFGRTTLKEVIPVIVGSFIIILIAAIAWWIWISRHAGGNGKILKRHKSTHRSSPNEDREGDYIYCHQCGQRAAHNDLFCRTCGTKLRKV